MSDGIDKMVVSTNSVPFWIISKLLNRKYTFSISSNYMNTGVTINLFMRKKIFYKKDNEANSCRSNYVG